MVLCLESAKGDERRTPDQPLLSFPGPMPFDEAGMEVLEWLENAPFEWDMYVDLPANCIRYCFRTLLDAAAFKQRFANASERRAVAGQH
jgi:hypothetical protein